MWGLGALRHPWKWKVGGELHKWDFVQKNFGMGKMLLVLPVEERDFLLNNPLILQGFFLKKKKKKNPSSVVIVSDRQQIEKTFVGQLLNYTINYNVKWYSYAGKPFRVSRVIKMWSQQSCVWIFIAALFVIGQNWTQPMCHHPVKQTVVYPCNRVLGSKRRSYACPLPRQLSVGTWKVLSKCLVMKKKKTRLWV